MSDTTTSGDRGVGTNQLSGQMLVETDLSVNAPSAEPPKPATAAVIGRSPGQLAWLRLKRDRVAITSAWILGITAVIVLLAPLIQWLYGDDPEVGHSDLLDGIGFPLGYAGGISGDHWLGLTQGNGHDLFLQIVFGTRTSLGIALTATVLAVGIGIIMGIVAGYAGGWLDKILVWFIDFMLAFPFFLFAIALVPALNTRIADEFGQVAVWKRVLVIIMIFTIFGWMGTARLVRGQVISLREREYVEAARAAGAGTGHMLFRQLLPNIWAPVIVVFSLSIPTTVTAEAALSFLNIGVTEPVPDLGRLINEGVRNLSNMGLVPGAVFLPGIVIFVLVLAFNLLGDAVRDALDPKSSK